MNKEVLSYAHTESGTSKKDKAAVPAGCRVQLDEMDDVQAPPIGTKGTVTGVDDIGCIMVD